MTTDETTAEATTTTTEAPTTTTEAPQQPEELQLVPESVLRRKHDLDELKAKRAAQELENPRGNRKVFNPKVKRIRVIKPESFVAAATSRNNAKTRFNRVRKKGMQTRASNKEIVKEREVVVKGKEKGEETEVEKTIVKYAANSVGADVIFAIRIRNDRRTTIPPAVRKKLSMFRLRNVNEGVFVQYSERSRKNLQLLEPYIAYGILTKATISDLITRRGHGKVEGKRVPLMDNTIIETALGDDTGIICVEDLVEEIASPSSNFQKANNFLWPFHLTAPRTNFQKKTLGEVDGKDYGDRGETIDELIRQML
eukprot:CAMPEP_0194353574 /NCGR_PEP_ID=MMETSP0174-20130528/1892_1 /TAXON_ID=216777 /ORGANISM="Proboscia alata, Strain PI-D3" /LENGTH=310 /DNA_ID=CAMNT_0039122195 /DNA_START=58 /DNA_END=990 /DNA_ORIENTATION=-